ncbi:MAG: hypothetical protein ACHQ1H_03095 [Nitrososphaerales archaeon]
MSNNFDDDREDWKIEYEQASEDVRIYQTQGWQIPLATVALDALSVGAAWTAKGSKIISGLLLLAAAALTIIIELEMRRWKVRLSYRIQTLLHYDKQHNFSRFSEEQGKNLPRALGDLFFSFTLVMGFALLIGGIYALIVGLG